MCVFKEAPVKSADFVSRARRVACSAALLAVTLGPPAADAGQQAKQTKGSLVLKDHGSFFVGGQTKALSPTSDITINQMYVQYDVPEGVGRHLPVVMVHGCCLSSKTWETTPDGRMGWSEYFVRQHRPVYLADQSGRARSGFDAAVFNEVRGGKVPPGNLPNTLWADHQFAWRVFRFGPSIGTAWPDTQFPIAYVDELYKQMIPDLNATLPTPNPTWANMAALGIKLGGAILMGHSESSAFPARAALTDPTGVKGIVQLETGCLADLTADQYATLAKTPILIVVGDHFDMPQPAPACQTYMAKITAAGGDITFDNLPGLGIHGNSHMFMQDKNNLQIADLILAWIDGHVEHAEGHKK
jgi:pimeloyl-ACP methyl ester carboxylesterase